MATISPISRRFSSEFHGVREGLRSFGERTTSCFPSNEKFTRTKTHRRHSLSIEEDRGKRAECFATRTERSSMHNGCYRTCSSRSLWSTSCKELLCHASESSDHSFENHKESLDLYLEKIHGQNEQLSVSEISEIDDKRRQFQELKGLQSVDSYTTTLQEDAKSEGFVPSTSGRNTLGMIEDSTAGYMKAAIRKKNSIYARKSKSFPLYDEKESANLYLISVLLSMNIAVFLFEIASPIQSSDSNLYSLPLMYGAKVNDLIMVGEWWRLVTPMFLHAGVMHIALSSWVLLSFGPQVCKGYGCFTFFLIYLLGGISGNFTSFLHTTEPTVGGSGPMFAVIGSWLIYQMQNKDVTEKEIFDSLFQKAMLATAFNFVLGNFGPIDNWASVGAAVSGIIYGLLTSPVVQVDDASTSALGNRIKEQITLSRQHAHPCKSFLIFTLFLSALSSLFFFIETPSGTLELEELVQIVE